MTGYIVASIITAKSYKVKNYLGVFFLDYQGYAVLAQQPLNLLDQAL